MPLGAEPCAQIIKENFIIPTGTLLVHNGAAITMGPEQNLA
jgi:hypothetical protein